MAQTMMVGGGEKKSCKNFFKQLFISEDTRSITSIITYYIADDDILQVKKARIYIFMDVVVTITIM